jgi:hypothetical protein
MFRRKSHDTAQREKDDAEARETLARLTVLTDRLEVTTQKLAVLVATMRREDEEVRQ